MPVRPVLRLGHPTLSRVAETVGEFNTPALHALVRDMLDTMAAESGVGLAAPQIGVSQRLVVFGTQDNPRYPGREPVPTTVLVNPQIQPLGDDMEEDWEGCLSIPQMRGWVPRHRHILYLGFDAEGRPIEREASGFHARVVQHECDHLDGLLFPQRMRDLSRLGFEQADFPPADDTPGASR